MQPVGHISCSSWSKMRLVGAFLTAVLVECNRRLDEAERHCMICLMLSMVMSPLRTKLCIQLETGGMYPDITSMQALNGCYVSRRHVHSDCYTLLPILCVYACMLSMFGAIPSKSGLGHPAL